MVVAQPNESKTDEFNSKLEILKPFAIYCYDNVCGNDILSAKNLGLGIVLVRTSKYDVDKSGRPSLFDFDNKKKCMLSLMNVIGGYRFESCCTKVFRE